jgi:transketolase
MAIATSLRYDDLPELLTLQTGDEKHDWSSLSTLDVLWVLYDRVLGDDDRFLLSKGHGPTAYYAVLAAKGLISRDDLASFGTFDSPLGHHPDRVLLRAAEISSGSLGHGLPIAVGRALALDAREAAGQVYVLVGDAELEEGSNWEAAQYAGRVGLSRLTTIVIDNHSSTRGWPGGIARRFELEGWSSVVVDGRDHDALERALIMRHDEWPHVVVADIRR